MPRSGRGNLYGLVSVHDRGGDGKMLFRKQNLIDDNR